MSVTDMPALQASSRRATTYLLRQNLHDRIVGCLIGSALGDAIGLYTEFLSQEEAREAYPSGRFTLTGGNAREGGATGERRGPTPFLLDLHRAAKEEGHWTDDTDHALLLVLAFLHNSSTEPTPTPTETEPEPPEREGEEEAKPTGKETKGNGALGGSAPAPPFFPTPKDLAPRLLTWVQQGLKPLDTMPMGLGRLVGSVVSTKGFQEDPTEIAHEHWVKTGRRIAPNGSLMRTHPLGVMGIFRSEEETFRAAAEVGRTTHADLRCVVGCVVGTGLVRGLLRGEVLDEWGVDGVIERGIEFTRREYEDEEEGGMDLDMGELGGYVYAAGGGTAAESVDGLDLLEGLKLDDPPAIGYVYKTLGSGVMLLRMAMRRMAKAQGSLSARARLFEELITDLIMRGGDADTNACFAGALLGAYLGYGFLPDHWKHGLLHGEWLMSKAEAMCRVLGALDGQYVGQEDKDTWPDAGKGMTTQQEMEARWMLLQQKAGKRMREDVRKRDEAAAAAAAKRRFSGWTGRFPWQGREKR